MDYKLCDKVLGIAIAFFDSGAPNLTQCVDENVQNNGKALLTTGYILLRTL